MSLKLKRKLLQTLEVWFRCFHGTMNDEMYEIPVEEVYNVISMGQKRLLKNDQLNGWFTEFWIRRKSTFSTEEVVRIALSLPPV